MDLYVKVSAEPNPNNYKFGDCKYYFEYGRFNNFTKCKQCTHWALCKSQITEMQMRTEAFLRDLQRGTWKTH